MSWYVLYTKPKNEKKTAQLLKDKGITVYCPVQETIKQWSDRKKKIQEPVFKSYVFVELNEYETEQLNVLITPGAVRFLWWQGKPGKVREEEIEAIRSFLEDYKGAIFTTDIKEGETVKIKEGVLAGQEGTVIRMKTNKAVLQLKSLGWNIIAELPVPVLEKK